MDRGERTSRVMRRRGRGRLSDGEKSRNGEKKGELRDEEEKSLDKEEK